MTSLLDERELTPEERAAIADEPRPGVWIEEHDDFGPTGYAPAQHAQPHRGDGRAFSQHETDVVIVRELWRSASGDVRRQEALRDAVHPWLGPLMVDYDGGKYRTDVFQQRGGIHSDPLVRLLAFRAWGERDREWTKRSTAQAIAAQWPDADELLEAWRRVYGFTGFAVYQQDWKHIIAYQATRDGREAYVELSFDRALRAEDEGPAAEDELTLDVFDELDRRLEADTPTPSALPFKITAQR